MKKPLPVGIQAFGDIVNNGFLYADKTRVIESRLFCLSYPNFEVENDFLEYLRISDHAGEEGEDRLC